MVGYVCIEESFDTIFNMGCGEGGVQRPPPMDYGYRKSAMDERVKGTVLPKYIYSIKTI